MSESPKPFKQCAAVRFLGPFMPNNMVFQVLSYLDSQESQSLSLTCRAWREDFLQKYDQQHWKLLANTLFGCNHDSNQHESPRVFLEAKCTAVLKQFDELGPAPLLRQSFRQTFAKLWCRRTARPAPPRFPVAAVLHLLRHRRWSPAEADRLLVAFAGRGCPEGVALLLMHALPGEAALDAALAAAAAAGGPAALGVFFEVAARRANGLSFFVRAGAERLGLGPGPGAAGRAAAGATRVPVPLQGA